MLGMVIAGILASFLILMDMCLSSSASIDMIIKWYFCFSLLMYWTVDRFCDGDSSLHSKVTLLDHNEWNIKMLLALKSSCLFPWLMVFSLQSGGLLCSGDQGPAQKVFPCFCSSQLLYFLRLPVFGSSVEDRGCLFHDSSLELTFKTGPDLGTQG